MCLATAQWSKTEEIGCLDQHFTSYHITLGSHQKVPFLSERKSIKYALLTHVAIIRDTCPNKKVVETQ
jgi:hypothetical protein